MGAFNGGLGAGPRGPRSRPKKHKDVNYEVGRPDGSRVSFNTFDEAAGLATAISASIGRSAQVDVIVWSEAGAKFYGGDDAVASYREDRDASVFERISIKAESHGRIA